MANLCTYKNGILSQWKVLDVLVVFRIFDTWIHNQAPSEGELLSLNDPTFCL